MLITAEIIARKYALAYFRHYQNELTDGSIAHLQDVFNFCNKQKTILSYLTVPSMNTELKITIIDTIVRVFNANESFKKLLIILIKKHRLVLICPIIKHIIRLYYTQKNILEVNINTSHPLSQQEEASIIAFIQKKTGAQQILPNFRINPILISGIRIYTDTWLWENSVHQLLKTATLSVVRQVKS